MKHINFINALSPAEQQALARWYRIAIVSIISMFIGMVIVHMWQVRRILQVRSFYHSLIHHRAKYEKIAHEYAQNSKKYAAMEQYSAECTTLRAQLQHCIESLSLPDMIEQSPETTLSSWKWNMESFTATVQSTSVPAGIKSMHALQKLPIVNTVTIMSIQSQDNDAQKKVTLQLQGTMVKPKTGT